MKNGGEIDIGNAKHRPAPGRTAQTLLVALQVTAANLDILETWLYQRTGTTLESDATPSQTPAEPPDDASPAASAALERAPPDTPR